MVCNRPKCNFKNNVNLKNEYYEINISVFDNTDISFCQIVSGHQELFILCCVW